MASTEGTSINKTITDSGSKDLGNKPPRFNGDRDKFKNFLFKVTCYLRFHQKTIETDEERILFLITHLTDGAALWAETWIAGQKLNTDGLPDLGKYEDFRKEFSEAYEPGDLSRVALERLYSLQQGNSRADEFVNKFKVCAQEAGLIIQKNTAKDDPSDIQLREQFKRSLNPALLNQINLEPDRPANLYAWFQRAID
jgi:hypothetical protein